MNQHVHLLDRVETPSRLGGRFRTFDGLIVAAAIAAVPLTAASFFGRLYWLMELLTHFRLHFVIGAAVLFLAAFARRRFAAAMLAAAVAAANVSPLVPYIVAGPAVAEAGEPEIRIMAANVHLHNFDYAALRELIAEENPDVVGLMEVNRQWVDELSSLRPEYPYSILHPEDGAYGLALLSRIPLRESEASPYVEDGIQAAIVAELEWRNERVTTVLAHLKAPVTPRNAALRNRQIVAITQLITSDRNEKQILFGDLNTTPWSPWYLPLEREAKLVNAARGRGYHPTWPSGFGFLKIPIDHCLFSEGFHVRQIRNGADIGSDHMPLIVDVAIAAKQAG